MRTCALLILTLIAIALSSACSPFGIMNAMVPEQGYERAMDIPYASRTRQKLDVYVPRARRSDAPAAPVIVFFYGGGWASGDRGDYRFVGEALTSQGFIAVVPDYRIHPEAQFPNFVMDGAKAMRWVKDNIARYGGDPRQLFVMGHSAGAHLAAMLTLDWRYLTAAGMTPRDLRGMIGFAGPYDSPYLPTTTFNTVFGPEQGRWRSRPINFVDGRNPPMLLMTGDSDGIVSPVNTHRLAERITAHGGQVDVIELPDLAHAEIIARLAAPLRGDGDVLRRLAQFVREHAGID